MEGAADRRVYACVAESREDAAKGSSGTYPRPGLRDERTTTNVVQGSEEAGRYKAPVN